METLEKDRGEKRSRLLDAAFSLFTCQSIKPPTIDDVVKLAGVAKGTFYLYFRDKHDLLDQLLVRKFEESVEHSCARIAEKDGAGTLGDAERLNAFLDELLDHFALNKAFLPLMRDRIGVCYRLMLREKEHVLSREYEMLTGVFVNHGYSKEQSGMHIYMLTTMVASLCCEAAISSEPYTIDELKAGLHSMVNKLLS